MNELLCHLNHDPPNILRITKHHLRHEELAAFHVENYVLGSSYCRQLKLKGGVCIFVQNNLRFTPLNVDEYCVDQDIEVCAIHLHSTHNKLCILAIYRSPQGNFNTFLTKLDLVLQKFFKLNFTLVVCGDVNVNYLMESHKKNELNRILQSFNLSSIVNVPTRISPNSSSTIDNFFIDNLYINEFDISPSINGLSDHDGQILKILTDKQCTRLHTNSAGPQPQHLRHNTTCGSETTYI